MSIIGIDVSTKKISIATLYKKGFSVVELEAPSSEDWEQRFVTLQKKFFSYVEDNLSSEDMVYIEIIPHAANTSILIKLTHFIVLCRYILLQFGIPFEYVNNMTWKKNTGVKSKTRLSKDVKLGIRNRAVELFGDEVQSLSQDGADALLIAYYGKVITEGVKD